MRLSKNLIAAIESERDNQREKWGGAHAWGRGDCSSREVSNEVKSAVLNEECGEVARAVLENKSESLKAELVQVAAVACAWLATWNDYAEGKTT